MAHKLPIQTVVEEAWNIDPRYQIWNPLQNKDSIQEGVTMTLPVLSGLKDACALTIGIAYGYNDPSCVKRVER